MRKSTKTIQEQEAIIAEYLTGELSFRKLGEKHGVDFRVIHYWVSQFQGKILTKKNQKKRSRQR